MHSQRVGRLQWELQHDRSSGKLEGFLSDSAVYHVYVRKECRLFLQSGLFDKASTYSGMRGRYSFLGTLHGSTRRAPMQKTTLRPIGKALVLVCYCSVNVFAHVRCECSAAAT